MNFIPYLSIDKAQKGVFMLLKMIEAQKKRRNKPQTMSKIVQAACEEIVLKGINKAGINGIADTAGVNKILIYRYFGGWNGVIEAVFQQQLNSLHSACLNQHSAPGLPIWKSFVIEYNRSLSTIPLLFEIMHWMTTNETILAIRLRSLQEKLVDQIIPPSSKEKSLFKFLIAGITHLSLLSRLSDYPVQKASFEEQIKSILLT